MSSHSRRRIVVLRDFSYTERQGEEELAIERFLCAAPEHIDISVQSPTFLPAGEFISSADVLVSFGIKRYPDQIFEWLVEHPKHIHVAQDWWEPTQPQSAWRNRVIEQAAAVIFMSPLHQERYEHIYQVKPRHADVLPFPMLKSDWAPQQIDPEVEESAALWCSAWHPDYGNDLMLRWAAHEKTPVHAYGLGVPETVLSPLVEAHGPIALDAAALTFSRYKRFIFFPRTPAPFGFTCLLAYMLGLEVTYSGEIGCLSWGNRESLANLCDGAPQMFWDVVEEVAA